ncbi:hypothetical protein ACLOJK_010068 [Asimina triloba]
MAPSAAFSKRLHSTWFRKVSTHLYEEFIADVTQLYKLHSIHLTSDKLQSVLGVDCFVH